ncbi:hypothetical protein SCLCIDRAFT_1217656 [Scleroderma citrinum Foug A]|uniref:Uncharacterized protein n=1 Tax=Scleroderma citrinum Foug A TaxID=1036808 RepID=A0A0C2ZCI4_9AGAM|nr:hypothetical protein SCLCIDRAFT_1217656 [Scleroderma citrinum Foug A]
MACAHFAVSTDIPDPPCCRRSDWLPRCVPEDPRRVWRTQYPRGLQGTKLFTMTSSASSAHSQGLRHTSLFPQVMCSSV